MAFVEVRFPTDIAYGSAGGPEYSTDIVITHSGHEQRNSNWSQARARYNIAHGVKTQAQLDALIAFFRARKGRADGFRFKDWTDHKATGQLIGTGDGERVSFQLVKSYDSGSSTATRWSYNRCGCTVFPRYSGRYLVSLWPLPRLHRRPCSVFMATRHWRSLFGCWRRLWW